MKSVSRLANTGFCFYLQHEGVGAAQCAVLKDKDSAHYFLKHIIEAQGEYDIRTKDHPKKLPHYEGDFEFNSGWDVSLRGMSDVSLEDLLDHSPKELSKVTQHYLDQWTLTRTAKAQEDTTPKTKPAAKQPKQPKAPRIVEGLITLQQIVADPSEARAALRKASYPKPAGGWVFTDEEVVKVKAVLTKAKVKLLS